MQITQRTITTITASDEVLGDMELPFEPYDADDMFLSADGCALTYLVQDAEGGYGYEFPEGVEFVQANWRNIHYCDDADTFFDRYKGDEHYRVFPVGVYEHGAVEYTLAGESMMAHDQWDHCIGAAIAIPDDFTDQEQAARDILKEYTSWCNGEVFGIITMKKTNDGWVEDASTCWGFIGYEYAVEQAKAWVSGGG